MENAKGKKGRSVLERFLNFVDMPPNNNLCWIWNGYKDKDGYGSFKIKGSQRPAHRISYELHNGYFDKNLCVCHICDNPSCVNPKHLWVGTVADNNWDRERKGHFSPDRKPPIWYGKDNNKTKLTEDQIKEIIKLWNEGLGSYRLAKMFDVAGVNILAICNRKTWKEVTKDLFIRKSMRKERLNTEQVLGIKKLIKEGMSTLKIADKYKMSAAGIDLIKNGKTWKNIDLINSIG